MLINSLLVIFCFLALYALLEIIHRRYKIDTYFTRKTAHTLSGLGAITASFFLSKTAFLGITVFFTLIFLLVHSKKSLKSIYMEDSIGETLYPIALFMLGLILYDSKISFYQGVLILALSDTASALAGKKHLENYNRKMSFIAHFLTTFIIMSFSLDIFSALIVAALLAGLENVTFKGWDNLTVPTGFIVLIKLFQL